MLNPCIIMGWLGQTFLLFFARGTSPKRSGAVLACFWTESVRVPRFPGDTRDALWSPVARSAVDASRCCTWQRAHRAGPIGRALSGPPWGPLGGPFGPALGRALRAPVQQQYTYFLLLYRKEEERKGNWPFLGAAAQMALRIPLEVHFEHFWALLPKWFSGSFWKLILLISRACCPNGSQEASGGSF